MAAPQVIRELKRDALGRVELIRAPGGTMVRRVACGGRMPGSRLVARLLLVRERRALERLAGLAGVSPLVGAGKGTLTRGWIEGTPLYAAEILPRDFFEHLEALVREMHGRGVCHNDLHKEPNVLVQPDGRPALIDFQLASRVSEPRMREDLRHVDKHRCRYEQRGRPRTERRRSLLAALWMMSGKRLYNLLTRRILRVEDGEPRRPREGPWPEWGQPLGDA
ncbi:MAG: serine/threonine protein kinase [Planctomycetota bacterium]|nr:serine/threonine protein kinase [Planctomycetota bacterium]